MDRTKTWHAIERPAGVATAVEADDAVNVVVPGCDVGAHDGTKRASRIVPQTPLWVVFWIQNALPNVTLLALALWARAEGDAILRGYLLACFLAHTGLAVRAIWMRTIGKDQTFFGALARAACVPWVLNAVLLSAFLLLGTPSSP